MPKKPLRYTVWYLGPITKWRDSHPKYSWFQRAETDEWEMAVSLTGDLTRLEVPWQIRDGVGNIVAASNLSVLRRYKIVA